MKITVTELTNDVETHRIVVETDKATIGRAVGKCIQQRVWELGLVLDYCLYLTPEGEQVRFPLALELTKSEDDWEATRDQEDYLSSHLTPLEGCPTDEEIHLAALMADKARLETWYEEYWKPAGNQKWTEGRGYGYFPKEGL